MKIDSHAFRAFTLSCAFTLVEMLVVLAVFALLAALLFPVLASVREQGRKSACASNLHQLYGAFALYAEDHDRFLPPYDVRIGGADLGPGGILHPVRDESAALVGSMQPYVRSRDLWFCPSDVSAHTNSAAGEVRHQYLSYFYFAPYLPYYSAAPQTLDAAVYTNRAPARVFEPSDRPLLADSSSLPIYRTAFYSHNGQFNMLYRDGHLKSAERKSTYN